MSASQIPDELAPECWVLTPGQAGMRSQALGLAEAVGLPIVEKTVRVGRPWSWLPGGLLPIPLSVSIGAKTLTEPWPSLVIACGRRAIPAALAIKRRSGGHTVAVYVQDAGWAARKFDLVAAMPHDRAGGGNVVLNPTALHRVSIVRLRTAAGEWRARLKPDDAPLIGVLLGGDSGNFRFTPEIAADLIAVLRSANHEHGARTVITPSRRTDESVMAVVRRALEREPWATIWDGEGANPYLGILALSDRLVVTGESISMISEALATTAPVHILRLEGRGRRHEHFLGGVLKAGLATVIVPPRLDWSFAAGKAADATARVAERVRQLLAARGGPKPR